MFLFSAAERTGYGYQAAAFLHCCLARAGARMAIEAVCVDCVCVENECEPCVCVSACVWKTSASHVGMDCVRVPKMSAGFARGRVTGP